MTHERLFTPFLDVKCVLTFPCVVLGLYFIWQLSLVTSRRLFAVRVDGRPSWRC